MTWIHVDFWFKRGTFKTDRYLKPKEQAQFEELLRKHIRLCTPYVQRKFYLYEDIPHCFLALEVEDTFLEAIKSYSQKLKAPFIYKTMVRLDPHDETNGEGFLNIMNAMTEFYLFNRDNRISHVIHCCLEFMLQSRLNENEFYQNMAIMYQQVKRKGNRLKFSYKTITPRLRKKLLKYTDSLDLRKRKT